MFLESFCKKFGNKKLVNYLLNWKLRNTLNGLKLGENKFEKSKLKKNSFLKILVIPNISLQLILYQQKFNCKIFESGNNKIKEKIRK